MHGKFNCITVNFDRTQHRVYLIHNYMKWLLKHANNFSMKILDAFKFQGQFSGGSLTLKSGGNLSKTCPE